MAQRRAKNVTPDLQFMIICQAIEHDSQGNISFRGVFDQLDGVASGPVNFSFAVSVQYRGGTGPHKHWLRLQPPVGEPQTTDSVDFWLASTAKAHRIDSRINIGLDEEHVGKWTLTAVLDGRDILSTPVSLRLRFLPPTVTQ